MTINRRQFNGLVLSSAASTCTPNLAKAADLFWAAESRLPLAQLAKDPWFRPYDLRDPAYPAYPPKNDWVLLAPYDNHVLAVFYKHGYRQCLGIVEEIHFHSFEHAFAGLLKNDFHHYRSNFEWSKVVPLPEGRFLSWEEYVPRWFSCCSSWNPVADEALSHAIDVAENEQLVSVSQLLEEGEED